MSATTEPSSELSSNPRPAAALRRTPKVGNVRRKAAEERTDGGRASDRGNGIEHPRSRLAAAHVSQDTMGMSEE